MFLTFTCLGLFIIFFYLWGDYIKLLIFLEVVRLVLLIVVIWGIQIDLFSLNFFLRVLIFLVCESRIGFVLFIVYIRIESEVVKKVNLCQL